MDKIQPRTVRPPGPAGSPCSLKPRVKAAVAERLKLVMPIRIDDEELRRDQRTSFVSFGPDEQQAVIFANDLVIPAQQRLGMQSDLGRVTAIGSKTVVSGGLPGKCKPLFGGRRRAIVSGIFDLCAAKPKNRQQQGLREEHSVPLGLGRLAVERIGSLQDTDIPSHSSIRWRARISEPHLFSRQMSCCFRSVIIEQCVSCPWIAGDD